MAQKARIFNASRLAPPQNFTEVLSHHGKKQFTREVITWEKQPDISTAGHAPIPASGVDRHLWRVPHQPA